MKRSLILLFIFINLNVFSQIRIRYGATVGLNISTAILPELKLNTDIHSLLQGDDVVQGDPQLADYIAMYKGGLFVRLDGRVGSIKFNINYDKTNIYKNLDTNFFSINVLNIDLSYLDFEMTGSLNLTKNIYISTGYVPALLLKHEGNLDINNFDSRLLTGIGIRFGGGVTIDIDAIVGLTEIIDGSYIHNLIIPVTLNIPFK